MGNYFSFLIKQAFLTPVRNVPEKGYMNKLMKADFIQASEHYFLCKTKKMQFEISKSKIKNHTILNTKFIVGGKKTKKYTIDLKDLGENLRIDKSKSTNKCIAILSQEEELPYLIQPETFEKECDIDFNNSPEILYIGKSLDFSKRLIGHEKLELARNRINDDEDLRFYFVNFKLGFQGVNENNIMLHLGGIEPDLIGITDKEKIYELMERIMIHFFKPKLNELHKNTDIKKDKRLNELLLSNGITGLTCGYGMEGHAYQFWTKEQLLKSKVFSLDYRIINTDYYPMVDINLIQN